MPTIPIFNMFGRSPIGPLEKHMARAHACVKELIPFFEAVIEKDWEKANVVRNNIAKLENEADDMKRNLRLHLPKNLFMPIARTDVLELLTDQDFLANKTKDISGLVIGRYMEIPEPVKPYFLKLLERCVDASAQANKAIHELDELFEAGFSGKELNIIESMIDKLWKIERETDELQIEVRRKIFEEENHLLPVNVVFLYKVVEWIGDLGDHAQHVGNRLQILIAR